MTDLLSCLQDLQQILQKESDFCVPDNGRGDHFKTTLKSLFDLSVNASSKPYGPLNNLLINNLDEEAIWTELQSRNKPLAKHTENRIGKLNKKVAESYAEDAKKQSAKQSTKKGKELKQIKRLTETDEEDDSEDGDNDEEQYEEEDDDGSEVNMDEYEIEGEDNDETPFDERDEEDDEEEGLNEGDDDEDDFEIDEERDDYVDSDAEEAKDVRPSKKSKVTTSKLTSKQGKNGKKKGKKGKKGEYDDEMDMEAWLDAYEEMENKHIAKQDRLEKRALQSKSVKYEDMYDDADQEADDNDLELIQNAMYNSENEEEEEDEDDDQDDEGEDIRFDDFYVQDNGHGDEEDDAEEFAAHSENEDGEEEEGEDDGEEESVSVGSEEDGKGKFKTTYQRRAKELASQIKELEQELLQGKSWEMKGEVKAVTRPENSMLDLVADVDRVNKTVQPITQEYTNNLEAMIIKRIEDARFDDPRPIENIQRSSIPIDPNDKSNEEMDLSQEKSRVGLGDIYAEEYAKQFLQSHTETIELKTQQAHEEILGLFNELSRDLDALTHFYYTPRAIAQESKANVLANQRALPAMEMEDIAPFSQNSYMTQQAPEDILAKKSFRKKKASLSFIKSDDDKKDESSSNIDGEKNQNKKGNKKRKKMDRLDRKVEKHLRRGVESSTKKPFSML